MILAIDPGTKLGWAYYYGGIKSGMLNLQPKRNQGGGMRYLILRRWLEEMEPDEIYFEEVRRHQGTQAAHVYGGIVATITAWCEENEVPYSSVPVGTIKKHATGKGNANKDAMIKAAQDKLGYEGKDDNVADAMWILDYALNVLIGGE